MQLVFQVSSLKMPDMHQFSPSCNRAIFFYVIEYAKTKWNINNSILYSDVDSINWYWWIKDSIQKFTMKIWIPLAALKIFSIWNYDSERIWHPEQENRKRKKWNEMNKQMNSYLFFGFGTYLKFHFILLSN